MACYTVGYDVGKQVDPSACVVVERIVRFAPADPDRVESIYRVAHIQELLHVPYDGQVDWLARLMSKQELRQDAQLVFDQTGVGAAFGDMVQSAFREGRLGVLWPHGASIIAGDGRPGPPVGYNDRTVRKIDLVSRLRRLLDEGRFQVPVGIPGGEQLLKELRAFTAKPTPSGNYTYENATDAIHDDLCIAAMFACYFQNWHRLPRCLDHSGLREQVGTHHGRYV